MNIPHYNPATPDKLESLLYDLERYANCKDNIDPLIKAALIHYQFETIHPFEYGNGRIGRLLISVFLKQRNILSNHVLCLSRYLLINKINYFDRISQVQNIGDYGQWVKFFVKAFISSADHSINTINAYIKLRDNYIKKIMTLGKQAKNTMLLFEYIEKHPVFEISNVAESLNLSFSTVATATKNLEDLGILKCTNNQARNRCFAYTGYLELTL
jgi:Fic family protein